MTSQETKNKRKNCGESAKNQAFTPVLLKTNKVHLQSSKEHDIVDAHLPKKLKTRIAFQNVEPVFPNENSCENHTNEVRNAQFRENHRCQQDDSEHDEKHPSVVGDW